MGEFSFQNIVDADGYSIAITGMVIVFVALTLITLFIAVLPKALGAAPDELDEVVSPSPSDQARESLDEAVVVAIGVALREEARRRGNRG